MDKITEANESVKLEESAMAIVVCNGKILTTNEMIYGREILSLPKGHTEENESSLDAAIRECFEETNIVITADNLVKKLTPYSYEFTTPSNMRVRKTLKPFLFATDDWGNPSPKEERMISVQWMNVDEFLSLCSYENVKNTVIEALRNE